MANTKSALKRMRQSEKRRTRNRAVRSRVRTAVKTARTTLAAGSGAREAVLDAIRALDRAVSKGVVHRNTAARKKSALARGLAPAKQERSRHRASPRPRSTVVAAAVRRSPPSSPYSPAHVT